ncbi:MAG: SGNH/GDSL hydrolase family protein [Desulfamplus sp.]|nr:SGNH/GDSL hydrolase family protein [Desulfamplus sp.]
MKKLRSLIISLAIITIMVSNGYALEFKNIVVFGDSLSDNGNLFSVTGSYPPEPYYQGRISNGPVWYDYLVQELGITGMALNYAYAGAQTGYTNVNDDDFNADFPGFLDEVETYLSMAALSIKFPSAFAMPKDTLFIVWVGGNDMLSLNNPVTATAQVAESIANIQTALLSLIEAGASNFLIINIPDLGQTPRANTNPTLSALATQISAGFNDGVDQVIYALNQNYPNIKINQLDTFSLLGDFIGNSSFYGFTNIDKAQLNKEEGFINEGIYLFWDDIHPTTSAHKIIAKKVAEAINCESCNANFPYFEADFTLKVPSAKLGDNRYGFSLVPYQNPAEPDKAFWVLDADSIEVK